MHVKFEVPVPLTVLELLALTRPRRRNRGATGALAPAMLKSRRRKYLPPAIICQILQLAASQTIVSLYSFKYCYATCVVPLYIVQESLANAKVSARQHAVCV